MAKGIIKKDTKFRGVVEMKYFGKYRGQVLDNVDPFKQGRIKAQVPSVPGTDSTWCNPCVPYAGKNVGFFFTPAIGANVWVEFEEGEKDKPIWSGGFWGSGEVPGKADPKVKLIVTEFGTIAIDDTHGVGSVTIQNESGLQIIMDSNKIELRNGASNIRMTSAQVSVNDGALDVI
jgi:uncharacterized protein involved in type VI secretion and phage assembly